MLTFAVRIPEIGLAAATDEFHSHRSTPAGVYPLDRPECRLGPLSFSVCRGSSHISRHVSEQLQWQLTTELLADEESVRLLLVEDPGETRAEAVGRIVDLLDGIGAWLVRIDREKDERCEIIQTQWVDLASLLLSMPSRIQDEQFDCLLLVPWGGVP